MFFAQKNLKSKGVRFRYWIAAAGVLTAVLALAVWQLDDRQREDEQKNPDSGKGIGAHTKIQIRVFDVNGNPISDARVTLWVKEATTVRQTDETGRAQFREVDTTEVRVSIEAAGMERALRTLDLTGAVSPIELSFSLSEGVRLEGSVVDDRIKAIANAQISLQPADQPELEPWRTKSDESGHFMFDTLSNGHYSIEIQAEHHEQTVLQGIRVPAEEPLRILVQRTASLFGTVLDSGGRSAVGAKISIVGSGVWPPREVIAQAEGAFQIKGLAPGIYDIRASLDHQVSKPKEGIELQPGISKTLSLQLIPGVSIKGQVLEAQTDKPLPGSAITVSEDSLGFRPLAALTDSSGRFEVKGLLDIPHRVSVKATGFVSVIAQQRTPGLTFHTFRMQRAAEISGRVIDNEGNPVEGAQVELFGTTSIGEPITMNASGLAFQSALFKAQLKGPLPISASGNLGVTQGVVPMIPIGDTPPQASSTKEVNTQIKGYISDSEGRFHIRDIPPGNIQMMARHQTFAPGSSESISLKPGMSVKNVNIQLFKGGAVEGRLVDERGYPVSGVRVEMQNQREPFPMMMLSGKDGVFRFSHIYGEVVLTAYPIGQPASQKTIRIDSNQTHEVELVIQLSSQQLMGRTVDLKGFPIRSASIKIQSLTRQPPFSLQVLSGYDGRFEAMALPSPPYELTVDHPKYAEKTLHIESLVEGELTIELDRGVTVSGEVIDQWHQAPVEGVEISLTTEKGIDGLHTRSKKEGEFEFRNVTPGKYYIISEKQNYLSNRYPLQVIADQDRMEAIELPPIYLSPGGSISGEVIDRIGVPVSNAEVAIGNPPIWDDAVRTDPQGRFSLTGIPPDSTTLSARHITAGDAEMIRAIRVYPLQETSGVLIRLPDKFKKDTEQKSPSTSPSTETETPSTEEETHPSPTTRKGVAVTLGYSNGHVIIAEVVAGSRAARAGLREKDAIIAIEGETVYSVAQVRSMLMGRIGSTVSIRLRRGKKTLKIKVAREKYTLPSE